MLVILALGDGGRSEVLSIMLDACLRHIRLSILWESGVERWLRG